MGGNFNHIPQCSYVFKAGDRSVLRGAKNVGDQCGARKSHESGYCHGHAVQLGLIDMAQRRETIEKSKESKRQRRLAQTQSVTLPYKKTKDENCRVKASNSMVDEEILEILGINRPYDMVSDYSIQKELNEHSEEMAYAKKICFARWLEAKEDKRNPKSLFEVHQILNVAIRTLELWQRGAFIRRVVNADVNNRMEHSSTFVKYYLLARIKSGSDRAIELYEKYYGRGTAKDETKRKIIEIPQNLEDEAAEIEKKMECSSTYLGAGHALKESMTAQALIDKGDMVEN